MDMFFGKQYLIDKAQVPDDQEGHYCRAALVIEGSLVICQRCGERHRKSDVQLPSQCYYCPSCSRYGRITSKDMLCWQEHRLQPMAHQIVFPGPLTPFQKALSDRLVKHYQAGRSTLVWSVTGSGKTEMIFETIAAARKKGERVAIVSPRIDVCRELYPRIQQAFPNEDCLLLHGDSEEPYRYTNLLVATTHQLLHFYQSFPLIIVDEVDAFPYEGDRQLHYGLQHALSDTGCLVYLSATPSDRMLKEIKGRFEIEKMPLRFHQRPLIVPQLCWLERWRQLDQRKKWRRPLINIIRKLADKNFVLVFCPSIPYMERMAALVANDLSDYIVSSVSSKDPQRGEKVLAARQQQFQILFTTMILERGVTFESVSVVVLGANHSIYTKSALVQIAGRVDRKGAFHHGEVLFCYNQMTSEIRQAITEIKHMNQLAERWLADEM